MNNTILSAALFTLISTVGYADNTAPPTTTGTTPEAKVPAPPSSAQPTGTTPTPVEPSAEAIKPTNTAQPQPAPPIDCKYHISAETTVIEQSTLSTWAGKAAVQSFDFNPASIDAELAELKSCYTDQGWQGFNDALQKSGNVNAIKTQHLTVSSQVDGELNIKSVKDNQWKVTVPMQVVYQNDKEKLTQLLSVDLLVGRKISGDLGIMQMIATPRQTGTPAKPTQQDAKPTEASQPPEEQGKPTTTKPIVEPNHAP